MLIFFKEVKMQSEEIEGSFYMELRQQRSIKLSASIVRCVQKALETPDIRNQIRQSTTLDELRTFVGDQQTAFAVMRWILHCRRREKDILAGPLTIKETVTFSYEVVDK